jgi:ADP-ribose pyrophosphatase
MVRPKIWREIRKEQLFDCRVFTVERSVSASPFDGSERVFFRISSRDWAQIIPLTAAGEVVMVRQFRHGSMRIELEIPGGIVDPGEEPAEAAIRECLEETGYLATSVRPLGSVNPNPAMHPHRLHGFVAESVSKVAAIQNSDTEQTEVVLVPVTELPERLIGGEIDHSLVATMLWRFLHERCQDPVR